MDTAGMDLAAFSDADLAKALVRAWRESVRCWHEARQNREPVLVDILRESAESANAWWELVRAESVRRLNPPCASDSHGHAGAGAGGARTGR